LKARAKSRESRSRSEGDVDDSIIGRGEVDCRAGEAPSPRVFGGDIPVITSNMRMKWNADAFAAAAARSTSKSSVRCASIQSIAATTSLASPSGPSFGTPTV
jgi:hypothetical protein